MKSKEEKEKYVAFLRGINVGGHHKVPMAELRIELEKLNLENVLTILNSGNIIFDTSNDNLTNLEKTISGHLEKSFYFPVPTIIRRSETILGLLSNNPFKDEKLTKDTRLYVSFLQKNTETDLKTPWISAENSFKIIGKNANTIFSVLDLSMSKTPKAMGALERYFGKDITTRNWKTIERIGKKLEGSRL